MRPFLHVSCCAYKLFWLCYESNCMKGESRKYIHDVDHMVYNSEKNLLQITISLRKWIQLKVYSHPVKNVWISSLTLIMIFWWIELAILRSHRKIYQNFIFNSEDIWKRKFVFYQTLIAFFHTGKPVSSRVLVETSDGFYMLYVPNCMKF